MIKRPIDAAAKFINNFECKTKLEEAAYDDCDIADEEEEQ